MAIPEQPLPLPQTQEKKKRSIFTFFKVGIFEIIFVLIVLSIFFSTLNYFHVISLTKISPELFGKLPQKSQTSSPAISTSPSSFMLPISLNSPNVSGVLLEYAILGSITNIQSRGTQYLISLHYSKTEKDLILPISPDTKFGIIQTTNNKPVFLENQDLNITDFSEGKDVFARIVYTLPFRSINIKVYELYKFQQ